MYCPKCGYPIYCDCAACVDRIPPGYIAAPSRLVDVEPTKADDPGYSFEVMTCPLCGYENSEDGWLDIEWGQMVFGRKIYEGDK